MCSPSSSGWAAHSRSAAWLRPRRLPCSTAANRGWRRRWSEKCCAGFTTSPMPPGRSCCPRLILMKVVGPRPRGFGIRLGLVGTMLGFTLVAGLCVDPWIAGMRAEIGVPVRTLAADDARRVRFGQLHGLSTALLAATVVARTRALLLGTQREIRPPTRCASHDHAHSRRRHRPGGQRRRPAHHRGGRRRDRVGSARRRHRSRSSSTGSRCPSSCSTRSQPDARRPQGAGHHAHRRRVHERQRRAAQGAGPVREPAPRANDGRRPVALSRASTSSSSARTPRTCTPASSTRSSRGWSRA